MRVLVLAFALTALGSAAITSTHVAFADIEGLRQRMGQPLRRR